jgi:hypothetical protein
MLAAKAVGKLCAADDQSIDSKHPEKCFQHR